VVRSVRDLVVRLELQLKETNNNIALPTAKDLKLGAVFAALYAAVV
jgi:hypothetical protein